MDHPFRLIETGRVSPWNFESQTSEVLHGYEATSIQSSFHTTMPRLVCFPLQEPPRDRGYGRIMHTDFLVGAIHTPLMIDSPFSRRAWRQGERENRGPC